MVERSIYQVVFMAVRQSVNEKHSRVSAPTCSRNLAFLYPRNVFICRRWSRIQEEIIQQSLSLAKLAVHVAAA